MTKLKTLKDISEDLTGYGVSDEDYCKCSILKAEAIKWLKSDELPLYDEYNWIKHFFNLTEEDLK